MKKLNKEQKEIYNLRNIEYYSAIVNGYIKSTLYKDVLIIVFSFIGFFSLLFYSLFIRKFVAVPALLFLFSGSSSLLALVRNSTIVENLVKNIESDKIEDDFLGNLLDNISLGIFFSGLLSFIYFVIVSLA